MTRPFLLLTILAAPASAQDMDVMLRASEAYVSCLAIKGNLATADPTFSLFGWTDRDVTEAGTRFAKPEWADAAFALLSPDGATCDVASPKIGTEAALARLKDNLRFSEFAAFTVTSDADGCTLIQLDATATATLTSGGDPVECTSPTTSSVRFAFPPVDSP